PLLSLYVTSILQSSGLHPHQHSFPTRRSSDLPSSTACGQSCGYPRIATFRGTRPGSSTAQPAKGACHPPFLPTSPPVSSGHPRLDRKSTRLNSSHVSTSYAVFCLIKKLSFAIV